MAHASQSIIRTRMKKSAIPVRVSAWLEIWTEQHRQKRWKTTEEAKRHLCWRTATESVVSNWRSTRKEKTSPQRYIFVNNCIVFKVQEFMYKNTVVLASAPQSEKKRTEERHKLWGEERENKAKYRTERVNLQRERRMKHESYRTETASYNRAAVLNLSWISSVNFFAFSGFSDYID